MKSRILKKCAALFVLMSVIFTFALTTGIAKDITGAEINLLLGHSGNITSVVFSPDNKYAVSGAWDNTIILWDVVSGKEIKTFFGHTDFVTSVVFNPNGKYILSSSRDKTLKLWDVHSGKEIKTFFGHAGIVESCVFSHDGKYIVSGSYDKTLKLWDVDSGRLSKTFEGHTGNVNSVAFSPDSKYVISGSDDKTLKLWDVDSGRLNKTFEGHTDTVFSVAFSPEGKYVISGSGDMTIKLWDIATSKESKTFEGHYGYISSVAYSPDGNYIISGSGDREIKLWNVASGEEIKYFKSHKDIVNSVVFSSDSKYILSASADYSVKLWDIGSTKLIKTFAGYARGINSVAYSPDGKYFISGSCDHSLKLLDVHSAKYIRTYSGHSKEVTTVAYSPDGKYIISGSEDRSAILWEVSSGKKLKTFKDTNTIYSVVFSPDGKYFATCNWDGIIRLWSISSSKEIKSFKGHTSMVFCNAFSPDGKYIISASHDATIKLWDIKSGKEAKTFIGHEEVDLGLGFTTGNVNSAAFSPDGKYIISGAIDETLKLWDVDSGKVISTFKGHSGNVKSVSFSPDGKYVISGSSDKTIKLWDVSLGKEIKTFKGHTSWINSVSFSPNGKYIISGSSDATSKLWNVESGELIFSTISTAKGEFFTWTPEGYFTGHEKLARELVTVVDGMNVYSIDQFFEQFYRPDIVSAKIRGEDISKYAKGNIKNFKVPPTVTLTILREDGYFNVVTGSDKDIKIEDGTITVKVIAEDKGGGISDVKLFCNDKASGEDKRGFKMEKKKNTFEQVFNVALSGGENRLRAVGFSSDRTESRPFNAVVTYAGSKSKKPDMYVLSVGINSYKNARYNLNYCVDDSTAFNSQIEKKGKKIFNKVIVKSILNEDATRDNILKEIEEIKSSITPDDVFVFFYAGHGIALETGGKTEFYYVLHDITQMTDADKCAQSGISGTEMKSLLTDIKATKQVMFVDACNSGAMANTFAMRGAAEETALAKLSRASGTVVFASTTSDQLAAEFKQLGHGVFTYVIIDALNGKGALPNGQITVGGMKVYVDDTIPELTKKYRGEAQYPTIYMYGQDFPVGIK